MLLHYRIESKQVLVGEDTAIFQYRHHQLKMSRNLWMLLCYMIVTPSVLISSTTLSLNLVAAWVPQQEQSRSIHRHSSCAHNSVFYSKTSFGRHQHMFASKQPDNESVSTSSYIVKSMRSVLTATTVLTVGWWFSSIAAPYLPPSYDNPNSFHPIMLNVANAKEMASGSGSRVNKDPESLLRYGLPIQNKEVRLNCRL